MKMDNGGFMETKDQDNYYIGFDLGGSSLKYGYGNSSENLLYFNRLFHKDKTLQGLINIFTEAIKDLYSNNKNFKAIGLATPGIIDSDIGIILGSTPNLPFLKNINIKNILSKLTNLPVLVDNDANLMTYAEAFNSEAESVLGITIGTGIGSGFVMNKKIYKGKNFMAMEAGHIIIVPNGRKCLCGKNGCLEAYCSAESIKKIICETFPEFEDITLNSIFKQKSEYIKYEIKNILDYLAIGISNLTMILNPETIFIGGGIIEIDNFDFPYLKKQIYYNLLPEYRNTQIEKAVYFNKAGVIGAMLFCENK